MSLDNPTIIVIFVVLALIAIVGFIYGKNAKLKGPGGFELNAEGPVKTQVGNDAKLKQGAEIEKMIGTQGDTQTGGDVEVGNRIEVEGKIGEMIGRSSGPGSKQ